MKYHFRSPGRINLIGEHTDYNDGYVLPAAIDRYTYFEFEESDRFEVRSKDFDGKIQFSVDSEKLGEEWANYVKGALFHAQKHSKTKIRPWKIEISSDLPIGAGLSSSASLMVGVIYAVSTLEGFGWTRKEIAGIAHEAENEFMGVSCGTMDQYAVSLGKRDSFLLIDTMKDEIDYISASGFPGMLVVDSHVKHRLAGGEYNVRRGECSDAARFLGLSFRDMTGELLGANRAGLGENLYRRALHVVGENERVAETVKAMERKDWSRIGKLLVESHESLRDLYEVSTPEMDFIVDGLCGIDGIYGARMIGGGFGGSVLAVIERDVDSAIEKVSEDYSKRFGLGLSVHRVKISDGVEETG